MDNKVIKILRGAGIIFVSGIMSYILKFFYKLIVSRYLGPEDFGLFSLGMMVVNIFSLLTAIGLNNGIVKYIAHYNSLQDKSRVKGTILVASQISFIIGCISSLLIILTSKYISTEIFHNSKFQPILIIFAVSIPFFTQVKLLGKAFNAFKRPEYGVYSNLFGREIFSFLLAILIILLGGSIILFSASWLISMLLALLLSIYFLGKNVFPTLNDKTVIPVKQYRQLLAFSLPLFLSAIFIDIVGWSDTFFLGYFADATAVGIYNISLSLAGVIIIFLKTFSQMFFPIIVELRANGNVQKISEIFSIVARWIFLLSFPFFLIILLFPATIISQLFGHEYLVGTAAAVILLMGTFSSVISGPTEEVLKTFQKLKFIVTLNSSVALTNIILNIILIPMYGLVGAAIATTITVVAREIILIIKARAIVHFKYQLPYYWKYLLSGFIPSGLVYLYSSQFGIPRIGGFIILCISFIIIYAGALLLLRSFAPEDKEIVEVIEQKLKINLTLLKKLMQ